MFVIGGVVDAGPSSAPPSARPVALSGATDRRRRQQFVRVLFHWRDPVGGQNRSGNSRIMISRFFQHIGHAGRACAALSSST